MVLFSNIVPLILVILFNHGFGKEKEILWQSHGIKECPDYDEPQIFELDLKLSGRPNEVEYTGTIKLTEEITKDFFFEVKVRNVEKQREYTDGITICDTFEDGDDHDFWQQLWDNMGVTECPIPAGTYEIKNITVVLQESDGGQYKIEAILIDDREGEKGCFMTNFDIYVPWDK